MSIRREPTYLSTDVWRGLWIISGSKDITPDELANTLLDEIIKERWPSVINYLSEVRKMEREIREAIGEQK